MNVKIIPCAPKGKEYDKKRKRKEEIALKMCLRVGTITILFLRRKRVHVHSELQADINYIIPTSFSVVFPALDFVPTNLLLMLFSAETRVQLALSSNAQPSDASDMFGSPEGEGNTLNTRDLDTLNNVTAEVRKVGKSNSLFLLFHFESISHIVNILVKDCSGNLTAEAMTPFMSIALLVALFLLNSDRIQKAIEICSECLILLTCTDQNSNDQFDSALLQFYSDICTILFSAYRHISDYISAERYGRKLFYLYREYGIMLYKLGESLKAKEYVEKALAITTKIGDRSGEASCYGNLGTVFKSLGQYDKAEEYLQKALVITTEIGDRKGETANYGNLGTVFMSVGQYDKAKEYLQKALVIRTDIGDREGEASSSWYGALGTVFKSLGQYDKAEEYLQKALVITTEIGDRKGEAANYGNLGTVFKSLGQYDKAEEYLQKGLVITAEIGDRRGEAASYGNLGSVFLSVGQYDKAKEYLQKALVIRTEIGDRKGEAAHYGNLGTVFMSVGQYDKAKEYLQKALVITTEIGDRKGEAANYGNLGTVFKSLGQYDKAEEYLQKALVITTEIGNRRGEAANYGSLGTVFMSVGQYDKAKEYLQKALVITTEIGNRRGEAANYGSLGTVFMSVGQYDKAKEYLQKALVIRTEIGDREGEASCYGNLGTAVFRTVGDFEASEVCLEKALFISRDIGNGRKEFEILVNYAVLYFYQYKIKDSMSCLHLCIEKYEELRYFLGANDQFKTSLLEDTGIFPYKLLCTLLCATGNARDAIYVEELGRARGLSDLMAEKYSVETHISANPQSWFGIENILRKQKNCTCLYISYFQNSLHLWILKTSGVLHYRRVSPEENLVQAGLPKDLHLSQFLDDNFRSLGILPPKDCEDRSLNTIKLQPLSPAQKSSARLRLVEEDEDEDEDEDEKVISSLHLCYKMFIAPVYDLLDEPEVIIVPDRRLYKVPFAALSEKEGAEYLSETHKIRIIPSLTTLKNIQDSPEDYHSNTGALVIGNPKVNWLQPLPAARKEAEMVGRLVGVPPLVEEKATKQAVLERISSVSLIHFAAHGNAERGEIALSPIPTPNSQNAIPKEAYMLTMADVSRVKVRAKLVVLSCCHSGSGEIRAEGVIGIARAFLGSGARSVLVALWAIPDSATEQLMSRFYEHLFEGGSASESLHHAMKWMRKNGLNKMSEWASFTLIGDDVRLDFDTQRQDSVRTGKKTPIE
ncbi:tetratricopeptide repeat protein 28-like [Pocillopora verrucosa]|uniref:tetratricopeptide repeat protein 28-like n=1 Tax=Pocillopora verrucosa TaxID=203993 RepID=UPI00333F9BB8